MINSLKIMNSRKMNHNTVNSVRVRLKLERRKVNNINASLNTLKFNKEKKNLYKKEKIISDKDLLMTPEYIQKAIKRSSDSRLKLFSGSSNPLLASEIAYYLDSELSEINIKNFEDSEKYIQIKESVRGCDVFLIQPTCPPVNDNLMELFIMIDACKRASCRSITAVIPYYGYSRADRKVNGREAISAKLMANLLTQAGINRVLIMDIHSDQCIGYFDIPVNHVSGKKTLATYIKSKNIDAEFMVVVSPDVGGVARARSFAKELNDAPLAIIDKRRSEHNQSEVMNVIGDVEGKIVVIFDDMIDTAGTICKAGEALKENGAKEVYACATHAVFSGKAEERLNNSVFKEIIVTNTIPQDKNIKNLKVLSIADVLGNSIWCLYNSLSLTGC